MSVPGLVACAAWAAVLASWAVLAREDFLHKKIRHSGLGWILLASAVGWACLLLSTLRAVGDHHYWGYYPQALKLVVLSWAAALALWRAGVWPAGDAKLFGTLAFIAPLLDPAGTLVRPSAVLDALINAFLPAAAATTAQAAWYGWRSKLRHQAAFLRGLGPRKAAEFSLSAVAAVKGLPVDKAELALWASGVLMGGALSGVGQGLPASAVARSLTFFAFFWLWNQAARALGALAAVCAALTVFGWAAYDRGLVLVAVETLRMAAFGLVLWGGARVAGRSLGGAADALPWGLLGLLVGPVLGVLASLRGAAGGGFLILLSLGLFYGVATALVRLWETDIRHEVPPAEAVRGVVLAPSFLAQFAADERFARLYPDGLTEEQAAAVREHCRGRGIAKVPVLPTVSFAFWLFLGWALTRLLGTNLLAALR